MRTMTCIEDLRRTARRRVPRQFFEYADGGSYAEETLHANRADLERIRLRQRILVDVAERSTRTTILGEPAALPLSPGADRALRHAARRRRDSRLPGGAGRRHSRSTLSTMSICSIEDVAAAVDKPFWFQLYVMKDRGFIRALIERAAAAKCSALVLTVDLQILGQRHRDLKNGLTVPPEMRFRNIVDIATKPAWALSIARGKRRTFGNLAGHVRGMEDVTSLSHWTNSQFDACLNWKDVEWIASLWPGKLILKGILDVEDARNAAKTGAAALVVSNHGGRQLDGAPSSITRAAGDRRCGRLLAGDPLRRRHSLRTGRDARARVRRPRLPERPRLRLRSRRRRTGRCRARDRDHPQRARCHRMALTGVNSIAEINRQVIVGG